MEREESKQEGGGGRDSPNAHFLLCTESDSQLVQRREAGLQIKRFRHCMWTRLDMAFIRHFLNECIVPARIVIDIWAMFVAGEWRLLMSAMLALLGDG